MGTQAKAQRENIHVGTYFYDQKVVIGSTGHEGLADRAEGRPRGMGGQDCLGHSVGEGQGEGPQGIGRQDCQVWCQEVTEDCRVRVKRFQQIDRQPNLNLKGAKFALPNCRKEDETQGKLILKMAPGLKWRGHEILFLETFLCEINTDHCIK